MIFVLYNWKNDPIYLDNNGTTYPYKSVVRAISRNSYLGNPSGIYADRAKKILSDFRQSIKNILHCNHEIIITSGGSESNNLLLRGFAESNPDCHYILSETEHKTSLLCCETLQKLNKISYSLAPVDKYGRVIPESLEELIRPNTKLISIMHINNETGTINDLRKISEICSKRNIFFHSDIAQSFGKIPPNLSEIPINAVSISMHKLHGGTGVGVLACDIKITPQIAGVQNNGLRGGTENVAAIAGALACLKIHFHEREKKNQAMIKKIQYLKSLLKPNINYADLYNKPDDYEHNIKNTSFCFLSDVSINTLLFSVVGPEKFCNIKMREILYKKGIIVSIGSTCNTTVKGASHVLLAIKAPYFVRCGVLRVSISDHTTYGDIETFAKTLCSIINNCKK